MSFWADRPGDISLGRTRRKENRTHEGPLRDPPTEGHQPFRNLACANALDALEADSVSLACMDAQRECAQLGTGMKKAELRMQFGLLPIGRLG